MNPADTSPPRCVLHVEAVSRQSQRPDRRLVMSSAHPDVRTAPGLGGPGGQRHGAGPGRSGPAPEPVGSSPREGCRSRCSSSPWLGPRPVRRVRACTSKGADGQDCRWPRVA